jgi:uncharacterized protein (DUF427 family)
MSSMWTHTGKHRPPFAETPGPGQESVWDYPRPPRTAPDARLVEVRSQGDLIASSSAAVRALETAGPPTFYLPPQDVDRSRLVKAPGGSLCEWKGVAGYWKLAGAPEEPTVAWSYAAPEEEFERIRDFVAFYPGRIECFVATERVRPQPGAFYGGWVTDEVVGPFKGDPGTERW